MKSHSTRLQTALKLIDEVNSTDPDNDNFEGESHPFERLYSYRMTQWLKKLDPSASEELQLACRCQHIRRWDIPRDTYPINRKGYLQWRVALGKYHSEVAGEILKEAGYDQTFTDRVAFLLQKKNLKHDPEVQMIEDVSCLVFLEFYFADFASKHDDKKIVNILRKTWNKMSNQGHDAALKLRFSNVSKLLLNEALNKSI